MAAALSDPDGDSTPVNPRSVRRWEGGTQDVPSPVVVAVKLKDAVAELAVALEAIAVVMEGQPRPNGVALGKLRYLAVHYNIGGCHDEYEQSAKVARAALACAKGHPSSSL